MNIKQMAALNVAKILAVAVGAAIAVNLAIHYLSLAVAGVIIAVIVLAWFCKFAYDIELSKLESKNALEKLKEIK